MPKKSNKICSYPCCAAIVADNTTRCVKHKHQRQVRHRVYDSQRWKKFRINFLSLHPICVKCEEKDHPIITAATEIHHIIAPWDGGGLMDDDNLMALCNSCHSKITANENKK